jgi:hypothetical protein
MKNCQKFKSINLVVLITGLLTFSLSCYVEAQDSTKSKEKEGVVVLKIKKDDNGKTTVIDTTFTITTPGGHKELEEYLRKQEEESDDLGEEFDNIEVYLDMADFSDSIINDSVIKHLRFAGKDIRSPRYRWHNKPGEFDYQFDIPCPPDVPPPPFHGYEGFEGEYWPGCDMRLFNYDNKRQTLADIIGDIPMDRVKGYSIKERKNGKRIIIDIEDAPLIENHDRVIIIREPGRVPRYRDHSDRQMKVIIKSDDLKQMKKQSESPSTPPPDGKKEKRDESSIKTQKSRTYPPEWNYSTLI